MPAVARVVVLLDQRKEVRIGNCGNNTVSFPHFWEKHNVLPRSHLWHSPC